MLYYSGDLIIYLKVRDSPYPLVARALIMLNINLSQNITKSLFALVKSNGGLFKSDKQAGFILSHALDNAHIANQRKSFGEFGGCVRVIEYVFTLDLEGVVKVVKTSKTTGKSVVYFDRNNQESVKAFKAKFEAKNQRQVKADAINAIRSRLEEIEQLQKAVNEDCLQYLMTISPDHLITDQRMIKLASVIKSIKSNLSRLDMKHSKMINDF